MPEIFVLLNIIVFQVKGPDSFSILTKAIRVPAGRRAGLDIFATDLSTFLLHLQYQAITQIHLLSKNYHPFLLRSAFSPPTFQMTTSHVAFLSSPLLHGSRQGKSQIIELSSWLQEVLSYMDLELGLGASSLVEMGSYGRKYPTAHFCTKQH